MPAVLNWQRNSGGSVQPDLRFLMMGTVLGVGVRIARMRLYYRAAAALVTDDSATPPASPTHLVGVRLGIDDSTPPGLDPVTGGHLQEWLGIWSGTYRIVPMSTVNGWQLEVGPIGTVEWEVQRTVADVARALWVYSTPLGAPGMFAWAAFAYLETQLIL